MVLLMVMVMVMVMEKVVMMMMAALKDRGRHHLSALCAAPALKPSLSLQQLILFSIFPPQILQALLQHGAAVDNQDQDGCAFPAIKTKPFHRFVRAATPRRYTALMIAAAGGHVKCVRVLLESGADVDVRDRKGRTAKVGAANGA